MRFKLISTRANKAIFTLIFLLILEQSALCQVIVTDPIATIEKGVGYVAKNPVLSVSYSPDGTTLAFGLEDGTIELWDVGTRQNSRLFSVFFS